MRKYLLHVLIISFVFLLAHTAQVATYAGELEDAKEEVRNNPDYAVAHFNLGLAYNKSGKYKEAIESFKQAIRIDPDDRDVHYNLGNAHFNLGVTYHKSGKYKEAIESFKHGRRCSE